VRDKTLKIVLVVFAVAIGGFSAKYLRRAVGKDVLDYFTALFSVAIGAFILIERHRNAEWIGLGERRSRVISVIGIATFACGTFVLVMKLLRLIANQR